MKIKRWQLSFVSALVILLCGISSAQDEGANGQTNDATVKEERTIYVPFSKLQDVFEKQGRGVFLPYDQFQQLWKAARDNKQTKPPSESPVDAVITSVLNEASVQKDVVEVEATLTIDVIKKGWVQVPLRLKEAAIKSATIAGEPARITPAADGGYQLLIENKEGMSESIELSLVYSRAFVKSPGRNSVAFDAPQAPVNRWKIRIPQEGVKVNVQPMIAASEPSDTEEGNKSGDASNGDPAANPKAQEAAVPKEETILLAFVGAAPQVIIDWTPKSEGARGMTALTSVQVQQEIFLTDGATRTRATLKYDISRGELAELSVQVPIDHKVVNVFDANVRKWSVIKEAEHQRIIVELFEPAQSTQALLIEMEQFISLEASEVITAAQIRVEEVGRQQGTLVVNVDPALKAESTTRAGLLQVDASELPPSQGGEKWSFAYRYASLPYSLGINVEKIQPRISVLQLVESYLEPETWTVDLLATYNIEDAGVFQLEFTVPQGFEVNQARGRELPDIAAASVDSFHVEGDNQERLIVNLSRRAIGKVGLHVQLQRRLDDANLLTPTGVASVLALGLPQANQTNLIQSEGRLVVYSPESVRVNPVSSKGLRPISFSEAYQIVSSIREGRFPNTRPALAFAYSDQAAQLEFSAERRKPYVTARQRLGVRFDSGVVRYESMIFYEILYSAVKSLRIDIPSNIASDIRNTSSGIREVPMDPQPADVEQGYVAWALSGETELVGNHVVVLSWEQKLPQLEVGKSVDVDILPLKPLAIDRAWGQIVVSKAESLDVQPSDESTGLRSIDPAHDVMADARVSDAARAFEYYDAWRLKLSATRFQLEEVKRTSIERGLVKVVVTRSGQQGVQALYQMRSARQRLSLQLPPDAEFDSQPARINGQSVTLERGDQGQLFIPLVGQSPDVPFTLEVRYSVAGDHQEVSIPAFPEDPAIQKIYLAVFLPDELTLIGSSGQWTEEFDWVSQGNFKRIPQTTKTDQQLVSWVCERVDGAQPTVFQTDGTMYLFSALRPQPPPSGNLKLRAMGDKLLATLILAPLAVIGLVILPRSLKIKIVVSAAVVIALLLSGTFAPTFAQQLLNTPFFAGVAMVGVLWTASYIFRGASSVPWRQYFESKRFIAAATESTTAVAAQNIASEGPGGSPNE